MFICYSLYTDLTPGINATNYDSVTADGDGAVLAGELRMVASYPGIVPDLASGAQLSIGFIEGVEQLPETGIQSGLLLAMDPSRWSLFSSGSEVYPVDPCGKDGSAIVFIPANARNALVSEKGDKVLETDGSGMPALVSKPRSRSLVDAFTRP